MRSTRFAAAVAIGAASFIGGACGSKPKKNPPPAAAIVPPDAGDAHRDHQDAAKPVSDSAVDRGIVDAALPPPETLLEGMNDPLGYAIAGSVAFWIELGANGTSVVLRASLPGGQPLPVMGGPAGLHDPVVDGSALYWFDDTAGTMMSIDATSSAPKVVQQGLHAPQALRITDQFLYWVETQVGVTTLMKLNKAAGARPASVGRVGEGVVNLYVADPYFFYTTTTVGTTAPTLSRVPLQGGPADVVIASFPSDAISIDEQLPVQNAYYPNGKKVQALDLAKVPFSLAGKTIVPKTVLTASGKVSSVAALGDDVFYAFAAGSTSSIGRVYAKGGSPATVVADASGADRLTIVGAYVYWLEGTGSKKTLMRLLR